MVLCVMAAVLLAYALYQMGQGATASPKATPTPTAVKAHAKAIEYFVPVTGFTSSLDNVSLAGLRSSNLIVSRGQLALVRSLLPRARFAVVPDGTVEDYIRRHQHAIGLLPTQAVDFRVRSLGVDGRYLWQRSVNLSSYPLRVQVGVAPQFQPSRIRTLDATGEIIPARMVEYATRQERSDYRYPYYGVAPFLQRADLVYSTFESAILPSYTYCWQYGCNQFQDDPRVVHGMTYAHIGVVSLADNHVGDGGIPDGIASTIRYLNRAHIAHTGASATNLSDARKPAIINVRGLRIAFLGYVTIPPSTYGATETSGGSAFLAPPADVAEVTHDVRAARQRADMVIVGFHWGIEYQNTPIPQQTTLGHAAIDAGASMVIGDHPHWVQAVEFYKGRFIIYGVGNFIFDQTWSIPTLQSVIVQTVLYGTRVVSVKLRPFEIYNWSQPRFDRVDGPEYRATLHRIFSASAAEFRG